MLVKPENFIRRRRRFVRRRHRRVRSGRFSTIRPPPDRCSVCISRRAGQQLCWPRSKKWPDSSYPHHEAGVCTVDRLSIEERALEVEPQYHHRDAHVLDPRDGGYSSYLCVKEKERDTNEAESTHCRVMLALMRSRSSIAVGLQPSITQAERVPRPRPRAIKRRQGGKRSRSRPT